MEALFDANGTHVGWIEPGSNIFDTELNWVVYIRDGHGWSARTANWLGPVDGLNCLDREGRLVAWNPRQPMKGALPNLKPRQTILPGQPPRPAQPMKPRKPSRPASPMGGWSDLRWKRWLLQ